MRALRQLAARPSDRPVLSWHRGERPYRVQRSAGGGFRGPASRQVGEAGRSLPPATGWRRPFSEHGSGAAKRMLCIAPEKRKASAVKNALQGPISTACPASFLRRQPQATLFLDRDSAAGVLA